MNVEVDFTQPNRGFQDAGSQVFWTIGSDHTLYRIELRSDREAVAVAANTTQRRGKGVTTCSAVLNSRATARRRMG